MKRFAVVYEHGRTSWGAYVPDHPGLSVAGDTFEEVQDLVKTAIELYVETLEGRGDPIPGPRTQVGTIQIA